MQVSPKLIEQIEDRLVAELGRVARLRVPEVCEQLEAMGERQTRPMDRQNLFSASAMLRVRLSTSGSLQDLMAERRARSLRASLIQDTQRRAIVLLDEDDIETQILAHDLANEAVLEAGANYPAYLRMLSEIAPASWKEEEINPLAMKSMTAILIQSLSTPSDSVLVKSSLRNLTVKAFAPDLARVIRTLIELMIEAGVTPVPGVGSVQVEASQLSGRPLEGFSTAADRKLHEEVAPIDLSRPAVNEPLSDATTGHAGAQASLVMPTPEIELSREVYAAQWLGRSPLTKASELPKLAMKPILQPVVEIERDAIAFAHSMGLMPYSRQARSSFFSKNRKRLQLAGASAAQLATVDVVGAMFDYVVDETRLPESVKPLFWRLQQPALALCLLDPSYLSDEPKSLRNLIENFGAISSAFSNEIVRGSELHRRLETVVRAIEIVTSSLQARSAVMAGQVEKEYLKASQSVTQLVEKIARERSALESTPQRTNRRDYAVRPSKERERAVTDKIGQALEQKFARYEVPDSVKDFLSQVWVRQLRTAALRDGEESAEYKVAMQVVDDLLWSLNGDRKQQSRKELAQRIPPLIRLLTDGVKRVGAKQEEQKAFFDELFLVHLRKMTKRQKQLADSVAAQSRDTKQKGARSGVTDVRMPTELMNQFAPIHESPTIAKSPRGEPRANDLEHLNTALHTVPSLKDALDTLPPREVSAKRVPGTLREMEALERGESLSQVLSPISIPRFGATGISTLQRLDEPSRLSHRAVSPARHSDADIERDLVAPTHLRVVRNTEAPNLEVPKAEPVSRMSIPLMPVEGLQATEKLFRHDTFPTPELDLPVMREVTVVPAVPEVVEVSKTADELQAVEEPKPARESKAAEPAETSVGPITQTQVSEADRTLTEDDSAQLFEVMNAVDLSDCPPEQSSMDLAPQAALDAIAKGSWIRLTSRDGEVSMFKVAWLNAQKTLALLVRFPDRRALSLRFSDLRRRLEEGHAAVMNLPEL